MSLLNFFGMAFSSIGEVLFRRLECVIILSYHVFFPALPLVYFERQSSVNRSSAIPPFSGTDVNDETILNLMRMCHVLSYSESLRDRFFKRSDMEDKTFPGFSECKINSEHVHKGHQESKS